MGWAGAGSSEKGISGEGIAHGKTGLACQELALCYAHWPSTEIEEEGEATSDAGGDRVGW